MQEYSNIVKKNNRSGVVGVCRYCASETRDLPEEKQRWFWVASWPLPDGRRKRVKFSVKKYGEDGAFRMAMDARSAALGKLVGAFDPGAVRRKANPPSPQFRERSALARAQNRPGLECRVVQQSRQALSFCRRPGPG
jgi:hypothetical protein